MNDEMLRVVTPRVYRDWNGRRGVFEWAVSPTPTSTWTGTTPRRLQLMWRDAWRWCAVQNTKEQGHVAR